MYKKFTQKDVDEFKMWNSPSADGVIEYFESGCRIMGLTRGEFSLIDLIKAFLDKLGRCNVVVVTWSAGLKDAKKVAWLLDTDKIETFSIITDHSYVTRQAKYAVALTDLFGVENIHTSEIHAKFTLIWNDAYYVVIRTSMNLNANRTCESFEIDESREIFEFYYDFVKKTCGFMPNGFEKSSKTVNQVLDRIFQNKKAQENSTPNFGDWAKNLKFD